MISTSNPFKDYDHVVQVAVVRASISFDLPLMCTIWLYIMLSEIFC